MDRALFETIWGNAHSFVRVFNEHGARSVTRWERFIPTWYDDGFWKSGPMKGQRKWSIGYGHQEGGENEPRVYDPKMILTKAEATAIFQRDAESKARFVRNKIDDDVWLTSFMFQALVSLVFNAGEGNVENGVQLPDGTIHGGRVFKLLNAKKYTAVCDAFNDHIYAWEQVKDENGNPVLDEATGKPLTVRVKKNGLIARRGCEIGIYMTYVEKIT